MSLELAIAENTRALNQLIAILRDQAANPVPVAENSSEIAAPAAEIDPPKTKRAKKEAAPAAPAGEPEASAPSPASGAADAPATEGAAPQTKGPATYDDAAAAVTKVQKALGTPKAKELLASFGGKTLKDVDPERFDELIMNAEELLSPDQP